MIQSLINWWALSVVISTIVFIIGIYSEYKKDHWQRIELPELIWYLIYNTLPIINMIVVIITLVGLTLNYFRRV